MKLKHLIIATASILGITFASDIPDPNFRGNWTETFQTNTSVGPITHTPEAINWGFLRVGNAINMSAGSNFNGHTFARALRLERNSTREEFVAALVSAGIYNETRPAIQPPPVSQNISPKAARRAAAADRKKTASQQKAAQRNANLGPVGGKKSTRKATQKSLSTARKAVAQEKKKLASQQKAARRATQKSLKAARRAAAREKKRVAAQQKALLKSAQKAH